MYRILTRCQLTFSCALFPVNLSPLRNFRVLIISEVQIRPANKTKREVSNKAKIQGLGEEERGERKDADRNKRNHLISWESTGDFKGQEALKKAGLAETTDGSERCPQDSKSRNWLRGWSTERTVEPANNQESMVQGVQGDTAEQASENEDTDELFDIPAVSYSSKNKAIITL